MGSTFEKEVFLVLYDRGTLDAQVLGDLPRILATEIEIEYLPLLLVRYAADSHAPHQIPAKRSQGFASTAIRTGKIKRAAMRILQCIKGSTQLRRGEQQQIPCTGLLLQLAGKQKITAVADDKSRTRPCLPSLRERAALDGKRRMMRDAGKHSVAFKCIAIEKQGCVFRHQRRMSISGIASKER